MLTQSDNSSASTAAISQATSPKTDNSKTAPSKKAPAPIPWSNPWLDELEAKAVAKTFEINWHSMGPRVKDFEAEMSSRVSATHALAVNNGTSALEISLQALDIGPGDKVAVPAFTYFATVSAVVRIGATPVFIDAEAGGFNLCPEDLARKIDPQTKAVVYIDYGGFPANYSGIERVARAADLHIIHDAAQSLGTTRKGTSIVAEGDIATTSFHAAKLMTTIEGGMIFCNDSELYARIRRLRNQGENPGEKYIHRDFGINARMTDIQASIGLEQLKKLDAILARRRQLAANYNRLLSKGVELGTGDLALPPVSIMGSALAWMFYPILVKDRDRVAAELKAAGIDTRIAYAMPTYQQPCVADRYPELTVCCTRAEYICAHVLNLPMFHDMSESQQQRVADAIQKSIQR